MCSAVGLPQHFLLSSRARGRQHGRLHEIDQLRPSIIKLPIRVLSIRSGPDWVVDELRKIAGANR
jgi:hypothetical protein